MPDLATFQLAFAAAIGRPGGRGALESQSGFAVYRNTAASALIDSLRAAYPVTAEILGGAAFDDLALDFSRRHPPADPVLAGYGGGFAEFLEAQPWIGELPYLAGVARLERLWTEAHLAADAPALAAADLAGLGAAALSALRLALHPAARTIWLRTPAVTIWQAHRDGFDTLAPEWRAEGALIVRPEGEVLVHPIDVAEHRLLAGFRLGETVAEAAASIAGICPECDFASSFANLVGRGAFARPFPPERIH